MPNRCPLRSLVRSWAGLTLVVLLSSVGTLQAEALPELRLDVLLDPISGRLEGEMTLTPPPPSAAFTLLPGLEVVAAEAEGEALEVEADSEGGHRVTLPHGAESLVLRWQGRLDGHEHFMVSPRGSLLPAHGGWYPRFEDLGPFALSLQVTVPPGQRAVGTGSLQGEPLDGESGYRVRHAHPRTAVVELAAGPWRERSREVDGVRLRTLFPATLDDAHAGTYLDHAADYLPRFAQRVGPYPFESFTIAASPAPVGLAYPGFTLLGERVIPLPFIPRTSLAHELMHAWWGAGVLVDYAHGNWAEALTTYLADYALDEAHGEARETRRRWLLDLAALPDAFDQRLVDFQGQRDPALRLLGYQHGAMLLHMLRRRIGDQAFDAGLRRFAAHHMHRQARWDDLAAALSEAAGEPLQPFVDAWTQRPGRPALSVEAARSQTPHGWMIEGTLDQVGAGAPWPLAIPVAIETATGLEWDTVALEERRGEFSLRLEQEPLSLRVDPDFDLLRQLQGPPILRQVVLDPASRLLALDTALAESVREALGAPLPSVAGTPSLGAGNPPLLVVGSTGQVADWLEGEGLKREGLDAAVPDMARRGQARAWALPGTAVVAISGDDRETLAHLLGSLRHQLAHSYLVLDGAETASGIWPLDETALRVDWSL
ncbi:M1 family metallopeptidase [Halomonas sp. A29]|uniref:M1 family metallopeptidase n=1 Tax=Halomonas sp. A29 TaxID=3102786 RepID=UPI00398A55E7